MTRNTNSTMRFLLALLLSVGLASSAWAGPDKDRRDRSASDATAQPTQARTSSASRPEPGSCQVGRGNGTLDANQVAATVFTTGSLFFGPAGEHLYYIPKSSGKTPVYASSVWIAGEVGGELRVAGSTYGNYEFWPGPLNADGTLPNRVDCSPFDKIYSVRRQDIRDYEAGGTPTADLAGWPANLGAPVIDGDGNPNNYNLAGGDRPDIIGDQSLWYVLNDVGNQHRTTGSEPIGLEVQIQAFSFARDNALGGTTFYKYNVIYKGTVPVLNTYLSVWSDPDLGAAGDDFIGVDPGISMGYVYNADEQDEGDTGYGSAPPAVGYDFFQGPQVDLNGDGTVDPDERLGLTGFMYFVNGDTNRADPGNRTQYYNIMRGIWNDGTPLTNRGTGYSQGGEITTFAYPGDPVKRALWSEENTGSGRNLPGDRRFVLSTGPFTLNPGDQQEIVFGIVYGRGNSRLSSITALRSADVFAQNAYDLDFDLPIPAPSPPLCDSADNPTATRLPGSGTCFYASETDGQVVLNWGYAPTDPAFLGNYESKGYEFEGFNLYVYPNGQFAREDRRLVASYDKINDITTLQNIIFDSAVGDNVPILAAQGTDSGLAYSFVAENLTNYTDYYYGLTTYIVDPLADQERVIESAPSLLTVRPSNAFAGNNGTSTTSLAGQGLTLDKTRAVGKNDARVRVTDPSRVTGATYEIRYALIDQDNDPATPRVLSYRIVNMTTGEVRFNGDDVLRAGGELPFNDNVVSFDGLTFDIPLTESGIDVFQVVANGSGPLATPVGGALDFAGFPSDRPNSSQQANSNRTWAIGCGYAVVVAVCGDYDDWLGLVPLPGAGAIDYEVRFPADPAVPKGGFAYRSTDQLNTVPFELWSTGIGTPDDASDDVRFFPVVYERSQGITKNTFEMSTQANYPAAPAAADAQASADSPFSSANNDPFSDLFNWAPPRNAALTGQQGYDDWVSFYGTDPVAASAAARAIRLDDRAPFQFMALVGWNLGDVNTGGYETTFPEPGTVFRIVTFKPIQDGDVLSFSTAELAPVSDQGFVQEDADRIGIVPNPYFGFSEYESGNTERVVRFTNLPERATIRIFTISGTLIRTLDKDSNERSFDWNLQTENSLPVASGLYLIHVDLPDSGLERVIKFGVVNRQTQIEIF